MKNFEIYIINRYYREETQELFPEVSVHIFYRKRDFNIFQFGKPAIESVQWHNQIGTLLTDQYGGLLSDELRVLRQHSKINHIYTAVDTLSSNGLNEHLNQMLVNKICCMKNDPSLTSQACWSTLAKQAVEQYNSTPHSITTLPPHIYLLVFLHLFYLPNCLIPQIMKKIS